LILSGRQGLVAATALLLRDPRADDLALELPDGAIQALGDGRAGVVESGGLVRMDFCLVAAEQAAEIARLDPERVRFLNAVPSELGLQPASTPSARASAAIVRETAPPSRRLRDQPIPPRRRRHRALDQYHPHGSRSL
jgi:hypothetical protein